MCLGIAFLSTKPGGIVQGEVMFRGYTWSVLIQKIMLLLPGIMLQFDSGNNESCLVSVNNERLRPSISLPLNRNFIAR